MTSQQRQRFDHWCMEKDRQRIIAKFRRWILQAEKQIHTWERWISLMENDG